MTDAFQLPFGSREERIAHNEAWSRSVNERRAEWLGPRVEAVGFRCECWQRDCPERFDLTAEEWAKARARPNRFAVAPDHVASEVETVGEPKARSGSRRSTSARETAPIES